MLAVLGSWVIEDGGDVAPPLVGPEAALVAATGVDPLVVWPAPHPATSALTPIAAAAQAMR